MGLVKRTLLAMILIALIPTALYAGFKEFCAGKYPGDYEMQEYCYKQQLEAMHKLHKLLDRYNVLTIQPDGRVKLNPPPSGGVYREIFSNCISKWKDDHTMQLYCFEKQAAAYQRLHGKDGND